MDKAKGSKEELTILHDAAKRQAWTTFHPTGLSRQASEQLNQIIHHVTHPSEESVITESKGEDTEFIALDMVDGNEHRNKESGEKEEPIATSCGPDVVVSVQDPPKVTENGKCTCNHSKHVDKEGELPWCEVCVASASPSKDSKDLVDMDLDQRWPTTWLEQYQVLTVRAFKQSRSLFLTKIDLIRHGFLSVIMGILFFQLPHAEERIHDIRGLVSNVKIH